MNNLKTEKGRRKAIEEINKSFLRCLKFEAFTLAEDAVCIVGEHGVTLGIAAIGDDKARGFKIAFASEIELHAKHTYRTENTINFGSSGEFSPKQREGYWRTLHAASVLENWDDVCAIVNTHCKMYADLRKEIFKVNEVV